MKRIAVAILLLLSLVLNSYGQVDLGDAINSPYSDFGIPYIYRTVYKSGAGFPFNQNGNLVLQSRSSAARNIVFMTGNPTAQPRMVITDGGYLGVGVSNPQSFVHIKKSNSGGTPHSFSDLTIEQDNNAMILLLTPNDKFGYYGFADSDDQFVGGMQYNHSSDLLNFRVNNQTSSMVIDKNGHVGIGLTTPSSGLYVKNDLGIRISAKVNGGFPVRMRMVDGIAEGSVSRDDFLMETDGAFLIKLDRNGNGISELAGFGVYNDNNENLFYVREADGNVGIGTTNPDHELTVKGSIHAEEVLVDLNVPGPDYVFEEDYPLQDLSSLEQYLKVNKHLPEVPSASEMETEGIKVGEMEMLLLKKVEELTLHLIEQNKLNKQQAEEIALLKKQLKQIENTQ